MKKILLIISMVIIGLLLILGGIYLSDKNIINLFDKKETKEENNSQENKNDDINQIKAEKITFDKNNEAKITVGNKSVLITNKINNSNEPSVVDIKTLTINNKKVLDHTLLAYDDIYLMHDVIIVPAYGNSIGATHIYIYDLEGSLIKDIYELDNNSEGMGIENFEFKNNKIIMHGTRARIGSTIIIDEKSPEVHLCDANKVKENNLANDYIVESDYEIEYLGNNKLSNIKVLNTNQVTLEQLQQTACNQ